MTTGPELPSARVERVLPARPETVYDAWLDERSLKSSSAPPPATRLRWPSMPGSAEG